MTFPPALQPTERVLMLWNCKSELSNSSPKRAAAIPVIANALQSDSVLEKACAACLIIAERIEEHLAEAEQQMLSLLDADCDLDGVTLLQLLESMQFNRRLRLHPAAQRLLGDWSKTSATGHDLAETLLAKGY